MMVAHVDPQLQIEWDALEQTIRTASSMSQYLKEALPSSSLTTRTPLSPHLISTLPPFDLPFPHEVLKPILELDIPLSIRHEIVQTFNRRILQLHDHYTASYKRTCIQSAQYSTFGNTFQSILEVYQALYRRRCIPMLEARVSSVLAEVSKYQQSAPPKVFNNEYTPILEKYFSYNGYPSSTHRKVLATKSGMTTRQIEVWFQNHRNRAKKDGQVIQRLTTDLPLQCALSISIVPVEVPSAVSSQTPSLKQISLCNDLEPKELKSCLDDMSGIRPPHAFPATRNSRYPDPFPTHNGIFNLPMPVWRRKPAISPIVPTAMDMDQFSRLFHLKLNFSESSGRRSTTPSVPEIASNKPWFTATTTFTSQAPHPALIRSPNTFRPVSSVPTPPLHVSTLEPIFGSSSMPLHISPRYSPPSEVPQRKIKPLPRRAPLPSSSNALDFRISSLNSVTSRDRVSSSSSSSSNCSSSPELLTPPPLPNLDLPVFDSDCQEQNVFDLSHTELETNFSLSNFLPSQGFNLALFAGPNKSADTPFFDDAFPSFGHNLGEILS